MNKENHTDKALELKSNLEKNFNFEVGEKPYIASSIELNKIKDFNKNLSKIILKIISLLCEKEFTDTLKLEHQLPNELELKINFKKFKTHDIIFRSDFCFESGIIKLLEINSGASIGGWELDFFHDALSSFYKFDDRNLKYHKIVSNFFDYASTASLSTLNEDSTGNFLFITDGKFNNFELEETLGNIYKNAPKYRGGLVKCFHEEDLKKLEYGDTIKIGKHKIDAIFNFKYQGELVEKGLNELWKTGKAIYSDNPVLKFIGSKGFIALMHAPAITSKLENDDVAWIKKHVPYTFSLGEKSQAKRSFLKMKDNLVLKKNYSLQGKDVLIGKDISEYEWKNIIEKIGYSKEWISQHFCQPSSEDISTPDGKVKECFVIWSAFNFGGRFGGVLTRNLALENESHLVNAAKGAFVNLVYENLSGIEL